MIAGKTDRLDREHNDRAWLAYTTAVLVRHALARDKNGKFVRMPKLEALLAEPGGSRRRRKPQTPEQMLAVVKMLNAAFGGNVVNETEH